MTKNEFNLGLMGDPMRTTDGKNRLRYIVAEALELRVKELRDMKRPDRAGRLQWLASRISSGQPPTKRVLGKCQSDIALVRQRVVDGLPIGRYEKV